MKKEKRKEGKGKISSIIKMEREGERGGEVLLPFQRWELMIALMNPPHLNPSLSDVSQRLARKKIKSMGAKSNMHDRLLDYIKKKKE